MVKKPSMEELIKKLNINNAYEVVSILKDMHDEEGKNAVLYALDNHLFDKAHIMLSPIKKPNKDEYILFFNPFKNAVESGTKPLKWPSVPPKMQYLADYTGILNTKDAFYDFYSIYSYLECMDNEEVKRQFIDQVTNPPVELFDRMNVVELPEQIENREANVYSEEDIIKYYPLPFVDFIRELYRKGIDAKTTIKGKKYGSIVIEYNSLSLENQKVVEVLKTRGLASKPGDKVQIDMRFQEQTKIKDIEYYLSIISTFFKPQTPIFNKVDINKYYEYLKLVMQRLDVKLPYNPSKEEKIAYCKKYNQRLTLSENGTFFYLHPGVKQRVEKGNGIKL